MTAWPAENKLAAPYHVSPAMTGFEELDLYGSWDTVPDCRAVWYPSSVPAEWAPYRDGQWVWAEPWGWAGSRPGPGGSRRSITGAEVRPPDCRRRSGNRAGRVVRSDVRIGRCPPGETDQTFPHMPPITPPFRVSRLGLDLVADDVHQGAISRTSLGKAEQRRKPQPAQTVWQPGSMEWLAEQNKPK